MKLTALMILTCGCGCGDGVIRLSARELVSIGPSIGTIGDARARIESDVGCVIFEDCEKGCDIRVTLSDRCGHGTAYGGHITINDQTTCPMPEVYDIGLSVHEIMHSMGHWKHDAERESVMYPVIYSDWSILQHDVEWLYDTRCQ